jgi:hypothetical protein
MVICAPAPIYGVYQSLAESSDGFDAIRDLWVHAVSVIVYC